tara:strand:+ start:3139 stop:5142 length:2004 start_codon:yes stop_codon:yes gene_type:complete
MSAESFERTAWPGLRELAARRLGTTQQRLDTQLHCTARMIGNVLNLRPPDDVETDTDEDSEEEVDAANPRNRQNSRRVRIVHTPSHDVPFSQHLKQEIEAFPFPEKLDELARMKTARRFVKNTYKLAETFKFMSLTTPEEDVNLADYSNIRGLTRGQSFRRRNRSVEHKFHVGEIAQRASESIALKTYKWLVACDHLMCNSFGDFGDSDEGRDRADSDVRNLIEFLSEKIAAHVTLDTTTDLSVQLLESRARAELVRNQKRAEVNARDCLTALGSLHKIAKYGSSTEESTDVIALRMHHIRFLIENVPPEVSEANMLSINPQLLLEACRDELDLELKCTLVDHWRSIHGPQAELISFTAIEALTDWMKSKKNAFIEVIEKYNDKKHVNARLMPAVPFVRNRDFWAFVAPRYGRGRTGLDFGGRRVVRLTSLIWQLFAHGEIRRGVVSSASLGHIAVTASLAAKNVAQLLDLKKQQMQHGQTLLKMVTEMTDFEGGLSREMTNALCEVSMFSYNDMHTVFSNTSPVSPLIMTQFSKLTRANMISKVAQRYFCVARDAILVVLPILRQRRAMLGKPETCALNPLIEMLKTIDKVREWTPLLGKLMLTKEDLNGAADVVEVFLKELESRKYLVQHKRAYIGGGMKTASKVYVFNTAELEGLLSGRTQSKP